MHLKLPSSLFLAGCLVGLLSFPALNWSSVDAWQLAQVGLNESYRVVHLSSHHSHVFLCISVVGGAFPTLVEVDWRETYYPTHSAIFPSRAAHANGDHSDCTRIQQARWTQVDGLGRLWVLDIGGALATAGSNNAATLTTATVCAPKLLAFDLMRDNAEVLRIDCGKYIQTRDSDALVVKMGPSRTSCKMERFIYFIIAGNPHLLAYNILEQQWQRRLIASRKYSRSNITGVFPVQPVDFTFDLEQHLLISDVDGALYSSAAPFEISDGGVGADESSDAMDDMDMIADHNDNNINYNHKDIVTLAVPTHSAAIELALLGQLLGATKGMMVDHLGALFYAVPKQGAVVRCDLLQRNLTTASNNIIFMTSKNIQQIFFGSGGSVWLLTDRLLKPENNCFAGVN